jgi:hypothetical protein
LKGTLQIMAKMDISDSVLIGNVPGSPGTVTTAIANRAATLAAAEATRISTEEAARVVAVKAFLNVTDGGVTTVEGAISAYIAANGYTGDNAARARAMVLKRFPSPQPARDAVLFAELLKQGYRG